MVVQRKDYTIITNIISKEHLKLKQIYGSVRLKRHIENLYISVLNHILIIRYKHVFGLKTIKRSKKGLSVSRAKEGIKKYVQWYDHEHIQKKLGYLSPVQY